NARRNPASSRRAKPGITTTAKQNRNPATSVQRAAAATRVQKNAFRSMVTDAPSDPGSRFSGATADPGGDAGPGAQRLTGLECPYAGRRKEVAAPKRLRRRVTGSAAT